MAKRLGWIVLLEGQPMYAPFYGGLDFAHVVSYVEGDARLSSNTDATVFTSVASARRAIVDDMQRGSKYTGISYSIVPVMMESDK